jgi:hypothetical protein
MKTTETKQNTAMALSIVKDIIVQLAKHELFYFDTMITIHPDCRIWAVCVEENNDLYLMDHNEQWEKLEQTDNVNYDRIVELLKDRMTAIAHRYLKAS